VTRLVLQTCDPLWSIHPLKDDFTTSAFVLSTPNPRPKRGGQWDIQDTAVHGVMLGCRSGAVFSLSVKVSRGVLGVK
jgi:hypothetical protein